MATVRLARRHMHTSQPYNLHLYTALKESTVLWRHVIKSRIESVYKGVKFSPLDY